MIKEMKCCTIQCDKCETFLVIDNDTIIVYGNKEKLIERIKQLGWLILETAEVICKTCQDKLSDEEKHCMSK